MRATISKSKNAEQIYITKVYRDKKGKSTSKNFKKLGLWFLFFLNIIMTENWFWLG